MVSFFGNIFRQIIPLSIRHTPMPGTILFLQAPRVHTSGVSGPQPQAFARAEEAVLGASFNTQSQAPDSGGGCPGHFFQHPVPGTRHSGCFVARCSFEIHSFLTGPIQGPGYTPFARIYGRAFGFRQRTRFNAQAKASDIHLLSLRASMEELSASFNAQDQAPDDPHAQDHPCAPWIFRRLTSACKVTHEACHPAPLSSTSVTRQCTGTF
jgi:hypothetical protein